MNKRVRQTYESTELILKQYPKIKCRLPVNNEYGAEGQSETLRIMRTIAKYFFILFLIFDQKLICTSKMWINSWLIGCWMAFKNIFSMIVIK